MKKTFWAFMLFTIITTPILSSAASNSDINKMTTYSVILGRAIACGINTETEMRSVGKWMDRTFPPGSTDQKTYLPIFMEGMKYHAQQQSNGQSPDKCSEVKKTYTKMVWK